MGHLILLLNVVVVAGHERQRPAGSDAVVHVISGHRARDNQLFVVHGYRRFLGFFSGTGF